MTDSDNTNGTGEQGNDDYIDPIGAFIRDHGEIMEYVDRSFRDSYDGDDEPEKGLMRTVTAARYIRDHGESAIRAHMIIEREWRQRPDRAMIEEQGLGSTEREAEMKRRYMESAQSTVDFLRTLGIGDDSELVPWAIPKDDDGNSMVKGALDHAVTIGVIRGIEPILTATRFAELLAKGGESVREVHGHRVSTGINDLIVTCLISTEYGRSGDDFVHRFGFDRPDDDVDLLPLLGLLDGGAPAPGGFTPGAGMPKMPDVFGNPDESIGGTATATTDEKKDAAKDGEPSSEDISHDAIMRRMWEDLHKAANDRDGKDDGNDGSDGDSPLNLPSALMGSTGQSDDGDADDSAAEDEKPDADDYRRVRAGLEGILAHTTDSRTRELVSALLSIEKALDSGTWQDDDGDDSSNHGDSNHGDDGGVLDPPAPPTAPDADANDDAADSIMAKALDDLFASAPDDDDDDEAYDDSWMNDVDSLAVDAADKIREALATTDDPEIRRILTEMLRSLGPAGDPPSTSPDDDGDVDDHDGDDNPEDDADGK